MSNDVLGPVVMVMAWLAFGSWAAAEPPVPQQHRLFLVLPVTRADQHFEELERFASEVDRELAHQGLPRLPFQAAASAFEERESQEPQAVTQEDIDLLYSESRLAAQANANRRYQEALDHARKVPEHLGAVTVSLNRAVANAREYLRSCVSSVRALLASQNLDKARHTARECRKQVPDLKPDPADTPPPVMAIFEELSRELHDSMLIVDSEPAGPDCTVFVEGRPLGSSPFRMSATVGDHYRVQVSCGRGGAARVHPVTIGAATTNIRVDVAFDTAVRTSNSILRLTYERVDEDTMSAHVSDVADALGVTDVMVVEKREEDGRLWLSHVRGEVLHAQPIPPSHSSKSLATALDELLKRSSEPKASSNDLVTSEHDETDIVIPGGRQARSARKKNASWMLPTGLALVGAGIVTTALETRAFHSFVSAGRDYRQYLPPSTHDYDAAHEHWHHKRVSPYVWGASSSVLLSVGGALLLPKLPKSARLWTGAALAAVGIGLVVGASIEMASGAACSATPPRSELIHCVGAQEKRDRGGLLMLAAAPLLVMPSILLAQHLLGGRSIRLEASASVGARHAAGQLQYRF
ncbi:MAG: hypothetical protein JWN04_4492 [Myxococcaceae bacterium]|nr:hypothetical protein [Myxococcaceae bacterium]